MTEKGFEVLKSVILIHKEILAFVVIGKDSNIENDFSDEITKLCELNSLQYFFRGRESLVMRKYQIIS